MARVLIKSIFVCMIFCLTVNVSSFAGTYINTYYNDNKVQNLVNGVEYINGKRLTNKGIIDVHLMKIDLNNKNLKFQNIYNEQVGKKTTLKNLLADHTNIVGAVNGDFFEMGLNPSFELGIVANNGAIERISSGEYYNCYSNSLSSMTFDKNNVPYINFIKPVITFGNAKDTLYISYYNKLGNNIGTVYLSGDQYTTSKDMDSRSPNSYKILVKNNKIIDIIQPGTSVNIQKDEYVVFLPKSFNRIQNFSVGDDVYFNMQLNVDNDIDTAIGGAGIILRDGNIVSEGYIINTSTSRTILGYDKGKKHLYVGTVGGQNVEFRS